MGISLTTIGVRWSVRGAAERIVGCWGSLTEWNRVHARPAPRIGRGYGHPQQALGGGTGQLGDDRLGRPGESDELRHSRVH